MNQTNADYNGTEIAIIGMAGRWPGASNPAELWQNICNGVESISHFASNDLEVSDAAAWAARSDYIRSRSVVDGVELFDAGFFGILPKEAELIDPQHRVFLEICWE